MEFKIDTKTNYTLILPETTELNENMAEALCQKVKALFSDDNRNYIIDLMNCTGTEFESGAEIESGNIFLELHHFIYNNGGSLVFTHLQDAIMQNMKKEQLHLSLNITPTLLEATDIISMEELERDLLSN